MAIWPVNKQSVLEFLSRHRLQVVVLFAIVCVLIAYHVFQRPKPFPSWDKDDSPHAAPSGGVASGAPNSDSDEEKQSRDNLFDPDSPKVAAKYKLPARLATNELHKLILDMECLTDLVHANDALFIDYNAIYDQIVQSSIKDVMFSRIKSQVGFKRTNLPIEWQQFSDEGKFLPTFDNIKTDYVLKRIERLQSRIIGAKFTTGDVSFVDYASNTYEKNILSLVQWLKRAKQLQGWLVEDSVIKADSVLSTSMDKFEDGTQLIADIHRRHSEAVAPTAPTGAPAPVGIAYDWNTLSGRVAAELTEQEHQDLLLLLNRECKAILNKGVLPNQFGTPAPTQAHEINVYAYATDVNADIPTPSVINVPPIERRRMDYLLRKGMLRVIGADLQRALRSDTLDDASAVSSLYASIMRTKAAHDPDECKVFADMANSIPTSDILHVPLTVGQVRKIKSTQSWLDDATKKYDQQASQMDRLVDLMRKAKEPLLRRLLVPYKFYEGTVDPFSSSPMRVYDAGIDPGPLLPDIAFPRFAATD